MVEEPSYKFRLHAIAVALFALVFTTHSVSPNATSSDSRWIVLQMVSLFSEGNTDLNEYPDLLREHTYLGIQCVDREYRITDANQEQGCPSGSRSYGLYPIGALAVALPPMVAMDAAIRLFGPLLRYTAGNRMTPVIRAFFSRDYVHTCPLVEMVLASFLMGVATAFVFLTGCEFLSLGMAGLLALLFGYGTAAWSTGSRALWQHGPEMLMIALTVFLLVKARRNPWLAAWSAIPLVLAYFIRPTGAIEFAVIGLFVWSNRRARFAPWLLLAAATAAPFLVYNFASYHRLLQPYFTEQHFLQPALRNAVPFLEAMAGQAVSPSRGVFVFSPFLLFALAGIGMAWRRHWQTPLAYYLAAILVLHWIAISAFADWTAGFSFGPRYFSDVTPIFIFFLIPVLAEWESRRAPRTAVGAFIIAAAIAFGIHFRGAVSWDVELWNNPQVNAARAWDWKDPQFLRGLIR